MRILVLMVALLLRGGLLPDCSGSFLLGDRGVTIADSDELHFTGPDPCEALAQEGANFYNQGKYVEALQQFQAALDCYQGLGDRAGEGVSLSYLGFLHYSLGQYEQALEAYQQALAIQQEIGDRAGEGISLSSLGGIYISVGQYQTGLETCQQALALQRQIGDRAGEGTSLDSIGFAYHSLGQYEQALASYRQALAIQQEIGDRAGEGQSLNNIGGTYDSLGRYEEALEYHQQALAIRQEIGDRAGEGQSLNNIGSVYARLGQYGEALEYYQQALALQREIGDRRGEGTSLNNIGFIYDSLGQYQEALASYRQALAIQQEIGDRAGEGVTLNNIGGIYHSLGRYEQALVSYQQALAIQREIGDRAGEGDTLNNIGVAHSSLGQYEEALGYYQQSLAIRQEIGDRAGEGVSLASVGFIYDSLGQYEEALATYRQALGILQEIGDRAGEGVTLNNIGGIYSSLGQHEEALETYQQALAVQQAIGDRAGEAQSLGNIGGIYLSLGQQEAALEYYRQALALQQEIGDRAREAGSLNNIGFIYGSLGQYEQALEAFQQAIEVIESIQGGLKVEELKASFAGEREHTYRLLIALLLVGGHPEEGFPYAERARARAFLDQMGNQQVNLSRGAAPELTEQEQELRQRILGLQNTLNAEHGKPFDQQSEELLEQLSAELENAQREHKELLTRLKLASPEYASLVSVSTLSLEEVKDQVLDESTTLIEYYLLEAATMAWVVDHEGSEAVTLDITRDQLGSRVGFLRDLIAGRDYDTEVAAGLYDALFSPLKPYIRHANLVIVPHGVLHYLPFAALWDAENERYLVEDYAVTYAPSASVLQYILDKRNVDEGRLLAMGNPDGSLPYAEAEAEAVAKLYHSAPLLGPEAAEGQVYAQAGQVDLLHLAAHGVYNPYNALYTRIELAADGSQDGNLEVHEVFGLDLRGTNLVVLSACETALGEQSEGDELVGLTRAFLYAGTPAVVTTLWPIDDAASGAVMEAFYGHLRAGMTNAEALRAAQMAVMGEEGWAEPYYWAAFSLTGDYLGSGEPGRAIENLSEPTQEVSGVETPTSVPAVEPSPTASGGRRGLCGSASLPLTLVLLAGIRQRQMRKRRSS